MNSTAQKGISDSARLSEWLGDHVPGLKLPVDYELIAAGGSNLTFKLTDANGKCFALRRGPVAAKLKTAHDMGREWRVMKALADFDSGVPVPDCLAFCSDEKINDGEFYVMSFAEGSILRVSADADSLTKAQADTAMRSLVEVQAAMHRLNLERAGLNDLSREHNNYTARQISRWQKQAAASSERDLPLLESLAEELQKNNPGDQAKPSLVHGDYRFDNTVLGSDCKICAVLDWELCAIGDPVADFFWSLLYWGKHNDEITFLPDPPTANQIFCEREEVIRTYSEITGFNLQQKNYFLAFGYWKMACIVEGVYARLRKGAGGGMKMTSSLDAVGETVLRYLRAAAAALDAG